SAAARVWSAPGVLLASCGDPGYNCVAESAPRAAVNARGLTLVAWATYSSGRSRVQVAAAGPSGRFEQPITMGVGLRPSVAGAPRLLGDGSMRHASFRAAPAGQIAVCGRAPPAAAPQPPGAAVPARPAAVAVYAPAGGWSILTPPLAPRTVGETVGPGAGAVA